MRIVFIGNSHTDMNGLGRAEALQRIAAGVSAASGSRGKSSGSPPAGG
jgi:hypothetical protein